MDPIRFDPLAGRELELFLPGLEFDMPVAVPTPAQGPMPWMDSRSAPFMPIPASTWVPQDKRFRIIVQVVRVISERVFIGRYYGELIKCLAFPSTANLALGSAVVVTRIQATTEYFYWEAPADDEILYFSLVSDDAFELWSYDGTTFKRELELPVIDDPWRWNAITSLCWCVATQSLFIGCFDGYMGGAKYIYEWKPGWEAPILRHTYQPYFDDGYYANGDPPIDWAEFKGKLYVTHSGCDEEPWFVARFDPTNVAATFEIVLAVEGMYYSLGEGGLGVVGDYIYALGSESLYRSRTGDLGTWELVEALWFDRHIGEACGFTSAPDKSKAFFVAVYDGDEYGRVICRVDEAGVTVECQEPLDWGGYTWVSMGWPYGSTQTEPMALQWYAFYPDEATTDLESQIDVYRRSPGGTWSLEDHNMPSAQPLGAAEYRWFTLGTNQTTVYFKGKPYVLAESNYRAVSGGPWNSRAILLRQDSPWHWVRVGTWDNRFLDIGQNYHYLTVMTLGKTKKLIQNI